MRSNNYRLMINTREKCNEVIYLIVKTLLDHQLKTGLTSTIPLKNGIASAAVQVFSANPLKFTRTHVMRSDYISRLGQLPAHGRAQFVEVEPDHYDIEFVYNPSRLSDQLSIDAYFLGYNGAVQSAKTPAYVDIPINAAENSFLFTGSLTGGSIVVTKLNETTYRVYHDGRANSSLLYDNVVMAIDYRDYQVSSSDDALGMAYMRFQDKQWQLVIQRQEHEIIDGMPTFRLNTNKTIVSTFSPDPQWVENHQQIFSTYREEVHQKLKQVAFYFGVEEEDISDGTYVDGEFSLTHPAILPWLNFKNEINKRYEEKIQHINNQIIKVKDELDKIKWKNRRSEEDNARIDLGIKIIEGKEKAIEYYRRNYLSVLTEVSSVEQSWLWLQIKNKNGFSAVVQDKDEAIGQGTSNIEINKRYDLMVHENVISGNHEFNQGIKNSDSVSIQNVNEDMSSLAMKSVYLNSELSMSERGALYQKIEDKVALEHNMHVLKLTSKTNELFQHHGSINSRLAPQDFYLPLMGDRSGGRCYPLVRAMAVALTKDGLKGANTLLDKIFLAAALSTTDNSILLKDALKKLHSNIYATQASESLGRLNLDEIKSELGRDDIEKMYALNTTTHAMLLGKNIHDGNTYYYFYDPNFGIFEFDSIDKLFSSLNDFMVKDKMGTIYLALGSEQQPIFELISINTSEMANVPIGGGLTVTDLSNKNELNDVITHRKYVSDFIESKDNVLKDLQIQASLHILQAEQWKDKINHSYNEITQLNNLNEQWIANFSNIEILADGKYRIQFINRSQEVSDCWIETSDKTFNDFRNYFAKNMQMFQSNYSFNNWEFQAGANISGIEQINGMNAGMAFYALLEDMKDNSGDIDNKSSSNLNTALRIHSYISYATMVQGEIHDSARISQLVHTLLREENEIEKIKFEKFSSALMKTANESIGRIFQETLIGLDIYELANAQNEAERSVFGTQLAFDSVISLESGISILGAENIAELVEPLSIPIFGVGIGIIELVKINALHAEEAAQVGNYFYHLKNGYKNAKLAYDPEKKWILPTDYIVYKRINFRWEYFVLDSQYIYRSKYGLNGSGDEDYISIWGSNPSSIINKDEAINIREAVGADMTIIRFDPSQTDTMILPIVPKSYIDYEYGSLAFSSYRHDTGFDILRDMEHKYRFDFDFFHGAYHKIITKLKHEYIYTSIEIILDENNRHLIVPNIPEPWKNKLLHVVKGYGGEYRININYGASLSLQDDTEDKKVSKWIIDTSFVNGSDIQLLDDRLTIDWVNIYIDELNKNSQLLIINKKNELYQVNLIENKLSMVATDASQWGVGITAEQYFSSIKNKSYLNNEFVIIHNYFHDGYNVGLAYYEVANNRIIFTNSSNENYHSSILGAVDGPHAYFFSPNTLMIWRVNIENGNISATYDNFSLWDSTSKVISLWKENECVLIKISSQRDNLEIISEYQIIGYELELLSVSNNIALIDKIALTATSNVEDDIQSISTLLGGDQGSLRAVSGIYHDVQIKNAKLMTIDGKDSEGINRRYWLRTDSKTLIKPNLEASFYTHSDRTGNIIQWTPPNDLMFIGRLFSSSGMEVFFFYSRCEDKIYRQEGLGQDIIENGNPTAKIIQGLNEIEYATTLYGNILIVNKQGEVKQLNIDGGSQIVGVNNKWLNFKEGELSWWSRLDKNYKEAEILITLLGLKYGEVKLPAWYFKGKIIIAHTLSSSHQLEFLGIDKENNGAYIFDITTGKLFYQEITNNDSINKSIGNTPSIIETVQYLPKSVPIYEDLQFKNIKSFGDGLMMITKNNEIIYHPMSSSDVNNQGSKLGSSLLIMGTEGNDIIIPTRVSDVEYIILSAGEGRDIYQLKPDDWVKYKAIIIDNFSTDKEIDEIILPIKDCFDDLLFERKGDDIIISDVVNDTLIILRRVFGSQAESYRHFKIKVEGYSFYLDVGTIINCLDGQELPISFYMIRDENDSIYVDLHVNPISSQSSGLNLNTEQTIAPDSRVSLRSRSRTNLLRERMSLIYDDKSFSNVMDNVNTRENIRALDFFNTYSK
ncbi:TcdA/TcdB pore-forming domain-containing protein [Providencia sp. PROV236]|uniref:TcdA/TcdB pore-forming domain-containing protein n=1 Tax=Providencia sp. PROV236 TaxID=2936798 RepID=UPI0034E21B44